MRLTEQLRQQAVTLRERVFQHPFVTGIGDGTLPLAAFRYYMCQDYVFLIDYCRVLALAVAKADDLEVMGRFAEVLHATLHTEMALHRNFAAQFGISVAELEATQAAPGTRSYTQHLLTTAYAGSPARPRRCARPTSRSSAAVRSAGGPTRRRGRSRSQSRTGSRVRPQRRTRSSG